MKKDELFQEISDRAKLIMLAILYALVSAALIPVCLFAYDFSSLRNGFVPLIISVAIYALLLWYLKARILSNHGVGMANYLGIFAACGIAFVACSSWLLYMLYQAIGGNLSPMLASGGALHKSAATYALVGAVLTGGLTYQAYRKAFSVKPKKPAANGRP